ncbi:MAG: virulence RhuM family protein [Candidatus Uhrbacteria bacterium]|nr:virulence RhuM family protein [Candidatus Uhrbacteria bacterium]
MKKNSKKIFQESSFTEIILYTTSDGGIKVEIFLKNENIWLTQEKIAQLFGVDRSVVTKHLGNILKEGELVENLVSAKFAHTAADGKTYQTRFYNLDAIISVGYRVNSRQATLFRIWATERLREYIIKGYTMNDERLKDPRHIFGKDYFEEQIARIRDIRSSERRLYQKITDIYAQCSADYALDNDTTKQFYATVQNKLHFAITGKTAAEIVKERADSTKLNMGLTTWKNASKGKIRESDVIIAKNYLNEDELDHLNRIVTMYLDYAEMQAKRGIIMYMKDWVEKLHAFLQFNEKQILTDAGHVLHEVAESLALGEYEKYKALQDHDYISDFDEAAKKYLEQGEDVSEDKQ